ncbi:6-hydroxynicotinate 3-monooxygenase [Venturia nashicola]|uniref:6-hydroxynicotinate 3-monooxygenase n=1 Tax=Venturia nashicola TaxID=86259 RepID=A0A4Z1P427_9PEZI|nr:6-hydroxynicotinate 3-monooxygenase [Venturia nashicola]
MDILILGGGVAGLTSALALTKFAPEGLIPKIQIFEIRSAPATIGGAINLTPNALRLLDRLGALQIIRDRKYGETINVLDIFDVYSGKLAESSFLGPDGKGLGDPPYKALRITRGDALKGILAAIEKHPNITLTCEKRSTNIEETSSSVTLTFQDGTTATGDVLLGCDGIHSVARSRHVEPERQAVYSGVSNAFGFAPLRKNQDVHFECTAINFARRGMLLTSWHEPTRTSVYVGALMQIPDIGSRDGWKAAGADQAKIKRDILDRFATDCVLPAIKPLIEDARDFYLWPVYTLSKGGKWATERTMLLGDAAHAMPPQGEATGIVFEDTVLFARSLMRWVELGKPESMKWAFDKYEALRRARIEIAFDESQSVLTAVSDAGWLKYTIKTYVIPWFIWWSRKNRDKHFIEDVTTSELGF